MLQSRVAVGLVVALVALTGCPPAGTGTGSGGGGGRGGGGGGIAIGADACGKIDTNPVGRKVYSFLVASAELDRASMDLENSVAGACRRMATALGVDSTGTTKVVCNRAALELQANLKISVKTESRLVTRYSPPVCKTEIDFAAGIVAQCEAKVAADVNVTCEGTCSGTCNGNCAGQCATAGTGGQCAGQCSGTCNGRCSGGCDGYAKVDASAECRASAEVRASLRTECSEPKVEVVRENVTIVDATKFNMAMAAIDAGMPAILRAGKKLELASKALVIWVQTAAALANASGQLAGQLGNKGLCVAAQLAAVAVASANIQVRFSVSIEASASVSSSAGAQQR